jgi:hypothetical protein
MSVECPGWDDFLHETATRLGAGEMYVAFRDIFRGDPPSKSASPIVAGVCRTCGCTDARGCPPDSAGRSCSWANPEHTLCSRCV